MATSRISNISTFDGYVVVTLNDGSTHEVRYTNEWEDGLANVETNSDDLAALADNAGLTVSETYKELTDYIEDQLQRDQQQA